MNNGKVFAGIDAGHIDTKAVIVKGQEVVGQSKIATGFDVPDAAQTALDQAMKNGGASRGALSGVITTGIFRDVVKVPQLNILGSLPNYVADARGALFLNQKSRTIIDIGGNIHMAVSYDGDGRVLDVIQNDKCADGLGIFYTTIARTFGLSERELSELALRSTKEVSVAIQCALSAESEALDLLCQGVDMADVAMAITKFMVERVAAMSTCMSLGRQIVVAGGLAKSEALVGHLAAMLKEEVGVLKLPEYVGALGAAVSCEGAE